MGNPICPLCGYEIDYSLDWIIDPKTGKRKRHPYSFEADHIVPISQGGSNSFENFQAVHRVCNQRKSNKPKVDKNSIKRNFPVNPRTSENW